MQDTVTPFVPPTMASFLVMTGILIVFSTVVTIFRQRVWFYLKIWASFIIHKVLRRQRLRSRDWRRRIRYGPDLEHGGGGEVPPRT